MRRIRAGFVGLLLLAAAVSPRIATGADGIWTNTGGAAQWGSIFNWATGTVAVGVDATAYLTNNLASNAVIDLGGAITLGQLHVGDASGGQSFTVTNLTGGQVEFSVSGGAALLLKRRGGHDTLAAPVVLGADLAATNNSASNLVLSGSISQAGGARSVTYGSTGGVGVGKFHVSGVNSYAGPTRIEQARVRADGGSAFGSSSVTVTNGGQLYLNTGVSLGSPVTASGIGWPDAGPAYFGAIRFENNAALLGTLTLAGETRVSGYNGVTGYLVGPATGDGTLVLGENGAGAPGALVLLGENTYDGTVISNQAVLAVGTNTATGTLGAGPVQNDGELRLRRSNAYAVTNLIRGAGALTLNGGGAITLTQPNPYTGNTTNLAGTLVLGVDNPVGTGLFDWRGGAIRAADAGPRTVTNLINLSVSTVLGDAGTGPLHFSGIVNNGGAAKALTVSNAWTAFGGPFTNTGPLAKQGPGDLIFSNTVHASSFTALVARTVLGPAGQFANPTGIVTVAAAGVLDVSAWGGAGGYVLPVGQTLRGVGAVAGDTILSGDVEPGLAVGTLTFSNSLALSGAALTYELAETTTPGGGVNDLIEVGGNLALSSNGAFTVVALTGVVATGSPYRVFTYTGALSGGPANLSVTGGNLRPGTHTFAFDTNTPGQVNLYIGGSGTGLVWAGDGLTGTGRWDLAAAPHWQGGEVYYDADAVAFDNTGGNNPTVTVAGARYPASVAVSADSNYVFAGGSINGAAVKLTKEGAGRLRLNSKHTFGGGTEVRGGTLALGAGGQVGTVVGEVTVRSGATLLSLANDSVGFVTGTKVNTLNILTGRFVHAANTNVSLWGETLNLQAAYLSPTGGASSRIDFGTDANAGNVPTVLNVLPDDSPTIFESHYDIGGVTGGSFSVRQALLTCAVADGAAATDLWVHAKVSGNNNTWVKDGPGTLVFSGANNTDNNGFALRVTDGLVVLGKASSPTCHAVGLSGAGLTLSNGTVQLAGTGGDQIYINTDVRLDGGVFDLNGRSEGFDGLSGAAGVVRNDAAGSAGTLTIGQANGGGQFNGVIEDGAGTVALTKMGTNTNILTGANTHSGPTVIGAGALRVGAWGGSGTLGTGNVTNNAALQLARGDYGMLDLGNTITGTGRVEVLGTYSATNGAVSLVTLSGDNSFTGTVTIATGALRITRSTSLGAGTKVVTMSNGTAGGCNLRLDPGPGGAIDLGANISFNSSWLNGTLYNLSGTNIVRGNWNLVGGGGDTAIISSNGFLTLAGLLRPSATDANRVLRLGGPADGLVTGDVANNGTNYPALRKIGPGAWTLNGTNTYTGPTLIDQGRLALGLTGSSSNSAAITVANGAVLDVTGTASIYGIPAGQTLAGEGTVTGSLAVSGDFQPGLAGQAGTMVFDNLTLDGAQWQCHVAGPTGSGATNDFVFAAGALALSSAAGVNQLTLVHPLNRLPGGTYVLITNRAARTVGGAADVALVNSNLYRGLTLDDSDPFSLRLMVAAPLELEWAGGTTGAVWDVGVSYAWNTNLDTFILGDGVWFTDFGGASNQVTLAGTLKPDLVRIQSSSNYTFTGSGKISGTAGLDKQGTGSLTIGSANDYTGPTTIGGGTVRVANAAALGAGAGATIVLPGGVLDVNSRDVRSEPVILSGGMLWNGWTQQLEVLRQLTVISNSAVGSSSTGRFGVAATGSGPTPWVVVSNDATLAVNAGNFDLRNGIRITNHGAIAVNSGGFLRVHLNARSQGGTGIYTVATGGTLELGSFGTQTVNSNDLVLAGGQLSAVNAQGANPMQAGALTAAGTGGVVSVSSNLYLTGPLLGTGTLAKIGAQELILSNDVSAFAGVLAINAGGVRLVQTQALELISPVTNSGPGTTGSLYLDTPGGVTVTGALHLGSQLRLAQGGAVPYAQLTIQPGATVGVADFWIGEHSGGVGDVWQNGGSVLVSNSCRVGHYPNETSHYVMAGGTLTLSATPTGIVNRTAQPEDIGILYVGIDGMAVFTQKAGVASAAGMVLDARGTTANPHEFTQEGGTFTLGASGIKSGSLDSNANYQINLGGGTLAASANWTSTLAMTLSGVNGPAVFDSAGRAITLHGRLSGAGGLTKAGVGSLTLRTNETYLGNTEIMAGSLILAGAGDLDSPSIHVATGALFDVAGVAGGTFALKAGQTLKGGGAVTGNVQNSTGATVAPGSSPGILTLQGNYTEQPGSILAVEVKGAAAGSGYDQLAVQGTAMLAGTLALDTGSYLASTSTAHVILTASNVTGAFANAPTSGAEVAGGSNVFVVTYTPTAVVLTARPAIVDADGDGLTSDLDPDDRNPNTDGGAMGDYDEWLAYGNATSVYEAFFLTSVGRVTNGTLLMWPAISNRSYRVFSTTNPVSGFAAWTNLVADLPPNSDGRYTNAPPRRFEHFRLDVRLPP